MFKIKYGISYLNIDVTNICYSKLIKQNYIYIPRGDHKRPDIFCRSS